jgi:hypothetical protein
MTGPLESRITRRWEEIDRILAWCDRPLRPDLAALDLLCQEATLREWDHALRAKIVRRWDSLSDADRERLRAEAAQTFARWQREQRRRRFHIVR